MSIRIILTDDVFPPSNTFIDFLETWVAKTAFDGSGWAETGRERVPGLGREASTHAILARARDLIESDEGRRYLARAYDLFVALLIGDSVALRAVQGKYRFILVVGVPRSGGKYITKQLFRALGHDPMAVPDSLAHDGFPDAGPWRFDGAGNGWTTSLQTMAEYLTMVEMFFGEANPHGEHVVVPKKAMKAAYASGLFGTALGPFREAIVTVRHPVPCCISTYEAAGGLPRYGRFAPRGNIEKFCARDLADMGFAREDIEQMDYFDAYLRYWENYQVRLAMNISNIAGNHRILPFGAERYMQEARQLAERFRGTDAPIEPFRVRDQCRDRYLEWMERAEPALRRVRDQWERLGLEFPANEIAAAW